MVFFGHRDAASPALVVALTVRGEGAAANTTRTLRLTSKHYLPTLVAGGRQLHKYARDVTLGDRLLMLGVDGDSVVGQVVDKEWQAADGLFNPYTTVRGAELGLWAGGTGWDAPGWVGAAVRWGSR